MIYSSLGCCPNEAKRSLGSQRCRVRKTDGAVPGMVKQDGKMWFGKTDWREPHSG